MNGGWFQIPGVQEGRRTLAEQLKGLGPALAACHGKTVWDVGTAEGLIAIEALRAGATAVNACDFNAALIGLARAQAALLPDDLRAKLRFDVEDLTRIISGKPRPHDVVLALAIVHKMPEPDRTLVYLAASARERLVIRLPRGSSGQFHTKHHQVLCNVNKVLSRQHLRLERTEKGPQNELVQYWKR